MSSFFNIPLYGLTRTDGPTHSITHCTSLEFTMVTLAVTISPVVGSTLGVLELTTDTFVA